MILEGAMTALVTPFSQDGSVDFPGFKANIQFQLEKGIQGLIVLGTTGETPTLTESEKQQLVDIAMREVRGKVPVIVGTGGNSTLSTVEDTLAMQKTGADAALVVVPYYNKPTQDGLLHHYMEIADSVDIPIVMYNVPSRCGVNMTAQTAIKLAEHPQIIGMKEASGDLAQIHRLITGTEKHSHFRVISGDDGMTFSAMMLGASGVISVTSNILPQKILQLVNACKDLNIARARQLNRELLAINEALFLETNPICVKAAMREWGMPSGPCRLPLCDMSSANQHKLVSALSGQQYLVGA